MPRNSSHSLTQLPTMLIKLIFLFLDKPNQLVRYQLLSSWFYYTLVPYFVSTFDFSTRHFV